MPERKMTEHLLAAWREADRAAIEADRAADAAEAAATAAKETASAAREAAWLAKANLDAAGLVTDARDASSEASEPSL